MPGKKNTSEMMQLVYYNHQLGKSAQELAQMFSVTRATIYNIIKRAENEGRLEAKPGGCPKKKINDRVERLLMRKINEDPKISTRTLAKELQEECGIVVSHETVRQLILKNKYHSRSAGKKPLLSNQHKEKRLHFALQHISQPEEFWDNVIFCDETKMMLYHNDGPSRVWRKSCTALQNKHVIPTVKFGKMSVMLWGCFSAKGVGKLAFIENTMDANQYLQILQQNLLSSADNFGFIVNNKREFKFYQDNDPKHKALIVRTWLLYNTGKVMDTPAQSPDLNPIEHLWAYLKKKVAKRHPKTMTALKSAIMTEWHDLPQHYDLQKLARSMRKRLQCVVDNAGGHTKY